MAKIRKQYQMRPGGGMPPEGHFGRVISPSQLDNRGISKIMKLVGDTGGRVLSVDKQWVNADALYSGQIQYENPDYINNNMTSIRNNMAELANNLQRHTIVDEIDDTPQIRIIDEPKQPVTQPAPQIVSFQEQKQQPVYNIPSTTKQNNFKMSEEKSYSKFLKRNQKADNQGAQVNIKEQLDQALAPIKEQLEDLCELIGILIEKSESTVSNNQLEESVYNACNRALSTVMEQFEGPQELPDDISEAFDTEQSTN